MLLMPLLPPRASRACGTANPGRHRPEIRLETLCLGARSRQHGALAEDDGPGADGGRQQHAQHQLHHDAGITDQLQH
jgi:hypothetical protein